MAAGEKKKDPPRKKESKIPRNKRTLLELNGFNCQLPFSRHRKNGSFSVEKRSNRGFREKFDGRDREGQAEAYDRGEKK